MKNSIKTIRLSITIIITVLFMMSCKKNGVGGKAEIHTSIFQGSSPIKSATLYVKFDATSQPSDPTTDFDLKIEGNTDDNHIHVEEVRQGEYYLYAVGVSNSVTVKGGVAISIERSERKKTKDVDIQLN